MISSTRAAFWVGCVLVSLWSPIAHAQSEKTIQKAYRFVQTQDSEKVTRAFQMLSDEIRQSPDLASPAGLWVRGDAAAWLAVKEDRGLATALVALESYEQSARMRKADRDMSLFAALEDDLRETAETHSKAATTQASMNALEAANLLLRADDLRVALDASRPVERARRYILVVRASLAANEVRPARKAFNALDAMGGFQEDLAITVAREVESQESPHQAFLFLLALREKYPRKEDLVRAFTDLCLQQGWDARARDALHASEGQYKDNYDDHLLLAGYFDALGDTQKSVEHYEAALEHAPRAYDANWLLATLLLRIAENSPDRAAEHRDRAEKALVTVLEANPEAPNAKEALAKIRSGR